VNGGKMPSFCLTGEKPDISHLHIFGSPMSIIGSDQFHNYKPPTAMFSITHCKANVLHTFCGRAMLKGYCVLKKLYNILLGHGNI
jgi:hypothetical protein